MTVYPPSTVKTESAVTEWARQYSADNPDLYVWIMPCFSPAIVAQSKMDIDAPNRAFGKVYFRNGKSCQFTEKQKNKCNNYLINND